MSDICIKGTIQSPINIPSADAIKCGALCELIMYYRTSKCYIQNTGTEIILNYDNGSYVTYNSVVYELDKMAFTLPASHQIDGYSYPAELQMYHRSPDTGEILVIAILIDVNDSTSRSNVFLEMITNHLPKKSGQSVTVNTPDSWNVFNMIPDLKSFYSYKGSLPRTPCTENVKWIVFDNAVNCSNAFFSQLKELYPNNARGLQKLNNRQVFYNSNTAEQNKRNYGDRLRCYTNDELKEQCSKYVNATDIMSKRKKQTLLIIMSVCIVIITIILLGWIYYKGVFGRIFGFFKTKLNLSGKKSPIA